MGNLGRLTWVRLQQSQEQCYSFLTVCGVFSRIQTKVWLPMLGIFNMCIDVNACDYTWGLHKHPKRVCTENWPEKKKPLPHRGTEPASVVCQSNALPTDQQPCQKYPPAPKPHAPDDPLPLFVCVLANGHFFFVNFFHSIWFCGILVVC